MKNSNKIILFATIALLSTLIAYNFSLKAEYLTSKYKDPFYNYTTLNYKAFSKVKIGAGNLLDVKIVKGDKFDIKVQKRVELSLTVKKNGSLLTINVKDTTAYFRAGDKAILITCPTITDLAIDAQRTTFYNSRDSSISEYQDQYDRKVILEGFSLQKLNIIQGRNNTVKLNRNTIGRLTALTGNNDKMGSKLIVGSDNLIEEAHLSTNNKNELVLNTTIKNLHLNYTDSASITLQGSALSLLKK